MGISQAVDGRAPIHNFYSARSWIEGSALQQLDTVAALPGVKAVAAMPDLHPGKYGPVGCAVLAQTVHPRLAGSDIGCGMGLYQLGVASRKLRIEKIADRLRALGEPWEGEVETALSGSDLSATPFDAALGSIGGGNHLCELQAIEEIFEPETASKAGLDRSLAYVL